MRLAGTVATFLICLLANSLSGQTDSLIFRNGDYMVGEAKDMDRNVLVVETDYSDDDFTISWDQIAEIYTTTSFLITLSDGRRFNGTLSTNDEGLIVLQTEERGDLEVPLNEIVFLKSVDEEFASRINAAIDFGLSYTKNKNFRQTSAQANVGYIANRWLANADYSMVYSSQDDVEPTRRNEGNLVFRYFLPNDYYAVASINFLSNTEQLLNLRTNGMVGLGKYFIHTNSTYWGGQAGLAFNNENFSSDAENRQSLEAFFGTEYNMYDVGDIDLLTKLVAFPSFTEKGRWRIDYKLDFKYDLPLDFYIRLGFSLNFDNQPVEGASKTDYVFTTSFGWEW